MMQFRKAALTAVLLAGTAFFAAVPARADVGIGFSFGYDGGYFNDPCDYYDYYDQPPPWGLPPDYCSYPVYFEPVYIGGTWYRGPIYYRWYGGQRLFWLNGGWRRDEWRGARPSIRWVDRGGGGYHGRGGSTGNHWSGNNRSGYNNNRNSGGRDFYRSNRGWNNDGGSNTRNNWNNNGGNRSWPGGGNNGGNRGWSGGSGGGHSGGGGWSGGSSGGHSSGGGCSGGHSGGGGHSSGGGGHSGGGSGGHHH